LNKAIIHGRLAKDPDTRTTQGGLTYTRLTVAVDRPVKQGEERKADFLGCVAWGRTAEFIGKYFSKGKSILFEGHIQPNSYTDKDGNKHYSTDIVIDRVEFVGDKGSGNTGKYEEDETPF
jgi:single-strand DNA-binding protein